MSRNIGTLTNFRRYGGRFVPLTQFGTWNGTATSAQLVDQFGNPVNSAQPSAIYRTDWQGQQLLYPTPRTNLAWPSQQFAAFSASTGVTVSDGYLAPDGSSNATLATCTSGNSIHTWYDTSSPTLGTGIIYFSLSVKNNSPTFYQYSGMSDNSTGVVSIVQAPNAGAISLVVDGTWTNCSIISKVSEANGYTRVTVKATKNAGTTCGLSTALSNSAVTRNTTFAGDGTSTYAVFGLEVESAVPGVYIPTTSAPVTLTDFTLNGTTVNLAQAPVSTATTNATFYAT